MENVRTCGGCTACCKTHAVHELPKKAGVWCTHCDIGKGCKIYEGRPRGCADFQCGWLLGMWNEEDRPDKLKIVPSFIEVPHIGLTLCLFELTEGALQTAFVSKVTKIEVHSGRPICHVPLVGRNQLYLPQNIDHLHLPSFEFDGKKVEVIPQTTKALLMYRP